MASPGNSGNVEKDIRSSVEQKPVQNKARMDDVEMKEKQTNIW